MATSKHAHFSCVPSFLTITLDALQQRNDPLKMFGVMDIKVSKKNGHDKTAYFY